MDLVRGKIGNLGKMSSGARMSLLTKRIRDACANARPPVYSGAPVTRPLDAKLEDANWISDAKQDAAVMLVDLKKSAAAVTSAGALAWVSPSQAAAMGAEADQTVMLGRREQDAMPPSFLNERYAKQASNAWCFASSLTAPETLSASNAPVAGFVGLRELVASAPPAEASLAGQARNLLLWHRNHAHCGVCGGPNRIAKGGWKRVCVACALVRGAGP